MLEAHDLRKNFGAVKALVGVQLKLRQGSCLGLLGPNGAGKTTTIEILEGLQAPDSGEVRLFGLRWGTGRDNEIRTRIGVALQETQLADKLTVSEVTRLFRSFYPKGRSVLETLELVALVEKRDARVHQLSGGQRQRLAVACALVSEPELLFLDEPTTGLDPQARRSLWQVIERYRSNGGSVLLSTHYMEEAAILCDDIAIIDGGRVIAQGSPEELIDRLAAAQVMDIETSAPLPLEQIVALPGVSDASTRPGGLRLAVAELGTALQAVVDLARRRDVRIVHLETHQATLEDVFLELTGKRLRDD